MTVSCADGTTLSVGVVRPSGAPRAVVLAGHAMMVSARSLDRPMGQGFASTLAGHDLLVLAADLRGHGQRGTPAARAFLAPVPDGLVELWHVGRGDHGLDHDPDHMGLVTDARCAPLWHDVARWILAQLGERSLG